MKKSLKTMLDEFLKHRSKSKNGEWAEVAEGDIKKLYGIVIKILEMKYERDSDNALPVEVDLIDRTRFERLHHIPIPYEHKATSDEERIEILTRLNSNAQIAVNALDRHIKILELIRNQNKKKNEDDLGIITAYFAENGLYNHRKEEGVNEPTKKCKCGNPATPGRGDYCTDCYFDAFGDEIDQNPIHRPGSIRHSEKYAIVLEMADMPVLGNFIANFNKPYRVPIGKENLAHNLLHKKGNMVIVADKKTLLENPFDLCDADFDEALELDDIGKAQESKEIELL